MAESIKDHSDYLARAKKGNDLRYAGLVGERDYKKAIQIVKAGGYATDNNYVSKICSIVEKWNLTQYDTQEAGQNMNIKIIDATMKKSPCLIRAGARSNRSALIFILSVALAKKQ